MILSGDYNMAVYLSKSVFYHIPKTGGTWIRGILFDSKLAIGESNNDHSTPDPKSQYEANKFWFCFVRHPLTFYQSYWKFRMINGWDETNETDLRCKDNSFHQFVENVLTSYPHGWASDLFKAYTLFVDFVGRQELLANDLIKALKLANENYDKLFIRDRPRENKTDTNFRATFTKQLLDKLMDVESWVINEFDYDYIPYSVSRNLV